MLFIFDSMLKIYNIKYESENIGAMKCPFVRKYCGRP